MDVIKDTSAYARKNNSSTAETKDVSTPEELYLDLLKKCLTRLVFSDIESSRAAKPPMGIAIAIRAFKVIRPYYPAVVRRAPWVHVFLRTVLPYQKMVRHVPVDVQARAEGRDWPADVETMIGLKRLDNLQYCITDVLRQGVPGDLLEAGVWRGGATIFMRAVLKAYGDSERIVWVADSFEGLPKSRTQRDDGDLLWAFKYLAVSVEEVKINFSRYGLLDEQVRFVRGWFCDTLPTAPIERLAVLRLDGDLYESTMDSLRALYPKVSIGGYVIIDDYGAIAQCRAAVHDYRAEQGITEEIESIDSSGVYWRRLQ